MSLTALGAAAVIAAAGAGPVSAAKVSPPTAKRSFVAHIVQATTARAEPRAGARAVGRVRTSAPWNGAPMQLLIDETVVDAAGATWYRVLLARKPNGSYGWIRADYAKARPNRWRITVDVSSRRLTIYRSGRAMRRTRVVVGARATPTPTGLFAIREAVRQPNPRGFSGPWIYHLNANSERLKSFDGGDGTIGIHGRGAAALADPLGSARSHGCVRAPNSVVRYMSTRIVAGTPVTITP
jgi:lipoprotein-anchoring transpeptidase ErfK/SrfK